MMLISTTLHITQGCSGGSIFLGAATFFFICGLGFLPQWLLSIFWSLANVRFLFSWSFFSRNSSSLLTSRISIVYFQNFGSSATSLWPWEWISMKQLRSFMAISIFYRRGSVLLNPRATSFFFISLCSFSRNEDRKGSTFQGVDLIFSAMNYALAVLRLFFSLEGLMFRLIMQSMNWLGISAKVQRAIFSLRWSWEKSLIFMKSTMSLSQVLPVRVDFSSVVSESSILRVSKKSPSSSLSPSPTNKMERGRGDALTMRSTVSSQSLILPSVRMRRTQYVDEDFIDMFSSSLAYLIASSRISEILVGPCIWIFLRFSLYIRIISSTPPLTFGLKQLPFRAKHWLTLLQQGGSLAPNPYNATRFCRLKYCSTPTISRIALMQLFYPFSSRACRLEPIELLELVKSIANSRCSRAPPTIQLMKESRTIFFHLLITRVPMMNPFWYIRWLWVFQSVKMSTMQNYLVHPISSSLSDSYTLILTPELSSPWNLFTGTFSSLNLEAFLDSDRATGIHSPYFQAQIMQQTQDRVEKLTNSIPTSYCEDIPSYSVQLYFSLAFALPLEVSHSKSPFSLSTKLQRLALAAPMSFWWWRLSERGCWMWQALKVSSSFFSPLKGKMKVLMYLGLSQLQMVQVLPISIKFFIPESPESSLLQITIIESVDPNALVAGRFSQRSDNSTFIVCSLLRMARAMLDTSMTSMSQSFSTLKSSWQSTWLWEYLLRS